MTTLNPQDQSERNAALADDAAESGVLADLTPSEALQKLRAGETLTNVRVCDLNLTGHFPHPIKMVRVTLIRPRILKATFDGLVGLYSCRIIRAKFDRGVVFAKGLNVGGSTFRKLDVKRVTIHDCFRCDNAQFEQSVSFKESTFAGSVRLWQARFACWGNFQDCRFEGPADFRSIEAEAGLQWQKCHFAQDALFRGAAVAKKFDLGDSHFEGLLDLSKAKLHDFAYLENIGQGPAQQFAFLNAVGDRVLVRPEQLAGRLASECRDDFATALQEFGLLKRNFETLHRYEDEDWAFYRFKVNQRRAKRRSWLRPWTKLAQFGDYLFLDWGCGYGTNPLRAIGAAVMIMLMFSVFYMGAIDHFLIETPPVKSLAVGHWLNRGLYGLMTSVSVFTAGFTGDHLSTAHGWILLPMTIEALMGTLLWGLFIVAFSRKVIR